MHAFCFHERLRLGFRQTSYPVIALLCATSPLWSLVSILRTPRRYQNDNPWNCVGASGNGRNQVVPCQAGTKQPVAWSSLRITDSEGKYNTLRHQKVEFPLFPNQPFADFYYFFNLWEFFILLCSLSEERVHRSRNSVIQWSSLCGHVVYAQCLFALKVIDVNLKVIMYLSTTCEPCRPQVWHMCHRFFKQLWLPPSSLPQSFPFLPKPDLAWWPQMQHLRVLP